MESSTPTDDRRRFDADCLAHILFEVLALPLGVRAKVAVSGGMDSTVLLHAMVQLRERGLLSVCALHANHGLHPEAGRWEEHCRTVCQSYTVTLHTQRLRIPERAGGGVEAAARAARYKWFEQHLESDQILLTAHHLDDQAETVLLRLMRGAGVAGVTGMPVERPFGRGRLLRPLLSFPRPMLAQYAQTHGLVWVEDSSNVDTGRARNYLRHRVLPILNARWPSANLLITRFADRAAEAQSLLDEVATLDLNGVDKEQDSVVHGGANRLRVTDLTAFSEPRLRNLLRFWFRQCEFDVPSARRLDVLVAQMIRDPGCSRGVIHWPNMELRRYRAWLYLLRPIQHPRTQLELPWSMTQPLPLPEIGARLHARTAVGQGLARERITAPVTVRWRRGGERCVLPGRAHHHRLKKLLQQRGVPPWQRSRIPLLYVGNRLAVVVGFWYCEPFVARAGESSVDLILRPF